MELNKTPDGVHSAVIALYERATDSLILTKRSELMRHHPGEICFPGGRQEIDDEHLLATALRELKEELGIGSERIHLIKALTDERTLLGAIIHPWLASIESIDPFILNAQEVTEIIRVPFSLVCDINNYKDFLIKRGTYQFKSCQFTASSQFIWGATARIMKQLCM